MDRVAVFLETVEAAGVDALGDAAGALVADVDDGDDLLGAQRLEGVAQAGAGGLGGVALAAGGEGEVVADFEVAAAGASARNLDATAAAT